jgi:hypothetical protein
MGVRVTSACFILIGPIWRQTCCRLFHLENRWNSNRASDTRRDAWIRRWNCRLNTTSKRGRVHPVNLSKKIQQTKNDILTQANASVRSASWPARYETLTWSQYLFKDGISKDRAWSCENADCQTKSVAYAKIGTVLWLVWNEISKALKSNAHSKDTVLEKRVIQLFKNA